MRAQATGWIACALLVAAAASADGGRVVLRSEDGPWTLTVLAEPAVLRAGPVRFSVLVQDAAGAPQLDLHVALSFRGPGMHQPLQLQAKEESGNLLFREVRLDLPESGTWHVDVKVAGAGQAMDHSIELEIGAPPGNVERYWFYIALGPAGALLLALHQARALAVAPRSRRQRDAA